MTTTSQSPARQLPKSRKAAQANSQGRKPLESAPWNLRAPEGRQWRTCLRTAFTLSATLGCLLASASAQTPARRATTPATKQPASTKSTPQPATPGPAAPAIAPVLFTRLEESLNSVKVGDKLPALQLKQLGGADSDLASRFGTKATVIAFWKTDRRMSRTLLADLGPDVVEEFGPQGVNVVGVAVEPMSDAVSKMIQDSAARFTNLLDADGKAFAQLGKDKLPRVYLVDPQGKILWFDIEYSLTTRRELNAALRTLVGENK